MTRITHTVTLDQGALNVTVDREGETGRPFLLLHGGGGPQTVAPFAALLARRHRARVHVPLHPGFGGTDRPDWLTDVQTLARVYAELLEILDLRDVVVVGNSIGGWTAAELAALGGDRIAAVLIVNGVGIDVPGHPIADTAGLTPVELSRLSFFDPAKFRFDPSALSDAQRAVMAANQQALRVYAGPYEMADPTLADRLAKITQPTLVAWGQGDQVVDAEYGRAYARAVPGAEFRLLLGAGHMPQLETPEEFLPVVWDFAEAHTAG